MTGKTARDGQDADVAESLRRQVVELQAKLAKAAGRQAADERRAETANLDTDIRELQRDQTQERETRRALHDSAERQNALLNAIPDIVMEVDTEQIYTWANEPGRRFFGDDVIGKKADFYFEGEEISREAIGPLCHGDKQTSYVENWQRRGDGERRLLAWWCRALTDQAGNVTGTLSTARDVTDERQKEREFERLAKILAAIRRVNQLIIRERDPALLIEQACDALVHTGAFRRSWLLLTNATGEVTHAASAGFAGHGDPVDLHRSGTAPGCLAALDHPGAFSGEPLQRVCSECPNGEAHEHMTKTIARLPGDDHFGGILGVSYPNTENGTEEELALLVELAGDLAYALSCIQQQTRRREAEEALRGSEDKFRYVFEHSVVGKSLTRPTGEICVNQAFADMLGYSREELADRQWQALSHPDDVEDTQREMGRLLSRERESVRFTQRYVRKDGTVAWADVSMALRWSPDGRPLYFITSMLDMTEQKNAEEALRRTQNNLRLGAQLARIGYWARDIASGHLAWSPETCSIYGVDPNERDFDVGSLPDLVHPEDRPRFRRVVEDALVGRAEGFDFEHRIATPGGEVRWVHSRASVERGNDGRPTRLFGIVLDITDRVRAEQERRELQASLAQSDRLASMGMLAAGVAHEINNPLSYVLYNLESLAEEMSGLTELMCRCQAELSARVSPDEMARVLGGEQHIFNRRMFDAALDKVRHALSGTQWIRDIAKSLGTFSRVERVEAGPVNVQHSVEHAATMASSEIKFRAHLVKDFSPVPAVLASEGKLAQVFLNLLINAAHAIDEGHVEQNQIGICIWSDADSVFVEVSDTGKGIAPEHQTRVFDPFFTTKRAGAGSGLGLSICKSIVTDVGGAISFTSTPGSGTTFLVRLPRMPSDWERKPLALAPIRAEDPPLRGRVLVVDDEDLIRVVIATMLEGTYDVVLAGSGREGRAILLKDRRFDVILCDLMMPDISGMELHAWLAEVDPKLADEVIFVTGGAFTPAAVEYLAKVGNARLEKPFDGRTLSRLVAERLVAARQGSRG